MLRESALTLKKSSTSKYLVFLVTILVTDCHVVINYITAAIFDVTVM